MGHGLAYWHDAQARLLTLDDLSLMAAQPHFAEAARMLCRDTLARYADFPAIHAALKDVQSSLYAFLIVYVHARGVITRTRVQEVCNIIPLVSPGRAGSILLRLRKVGFILPDPGQNSTNERRFVLAPIFETVVRTMLRDRLAALALVEPEAAAVAERLDEPAFFFAFVIKSGELVLRQTRHGPFYFAEHDAGQLILSDVLLSAHPDDGFPPNGEMKVSIRDLARRYGVSRAHVFRLFSGAEQLGLLKRNAKNQTCVLTEMGRTAVGGMAVLELIGAAVTAEHAIRATAASAQATASQ
jgi:hypothetical protein